MEKQLPTNIAGIGLRIATYDNTEFYVQGQVTYRDIPKSAEEASYRIYHCDGHNYPESLVMEVLK